MKTILRYSRLLLASPIIFTVAAAEGEAPGSEGHRIEEVQVTATRQAKSVAEVAAGVTVVSAEQLESAAPQVTPEALKGQTGAWVQQTTPGQASVFLRGLKGSEVLHLVDGMRLNNAFFRNAPSQYLALVDGQMLDRVEVLRGPASALYGSDAMGGVVQVLSAMPRFDSEEFSRRARLLGRYSSAHDASLTRAEFAAGNADFGVGGGISYQDVGERRAGDGRTLAFSSWRSKAANAAVVFRPAEAQEVSLSLQYLEQPRSPRHDELVAGFGQSEPASEVFNFEPNDRLFVHGKYSLQFDSGFMDTLDFDVAWQEINDDRRTRETGSTEERRERNRSGLFGLTVQGTSRPGGGHELVYGIEHYADEVHSSRVATDINTGDARVVSSRFPDGSTMDSIAVYVADMWQLSERLELDFGARYSSFETVLPAADRGVGAVVDVDDLTGNAGLNLEVVPGVNLVANAGRGFRPPNIFDLGTLGARPGNRFNVANPSLTPESVVTADVGVKVSRGDWKAELFAWKARYRDKIVSVPTGDTTDEGRQVVQSENLNDVALHGVEAGFRYVRDQMELYGAVTTTWGEERAPDGTTQPADRIPPANGRIGLFWQTSDRFSVEPFLAFARGQRRLSLRDIGDPRINPDGTAGWVTANLRLGWQIDDAWRLKLNLMNIGDLSYREHGSGIDAAGFDAVLSVEAIIGGS
ncbi:MAG: TonB-dependent receptor [Gammaproteobacteria bacterium]|nr:TonB-dependent receptor [Gammaproteobacteria bacterium]